MDLAIRGATVVDGTGTTRAYPADVRIERGRITEIGTVRGARRTLDARGLVLAPGFIDMHAHSDLALLTDPAHEAKAAQGVTLEVLGQDGLSYAPVDDRTLAELRRQIAGWNGDPQGLEYDWRSVGEYLDRLDRGIAVNAAYLVPQGTVRMLAVGWEDRPATPAELDRMRELVAEGLAQGAVGMSSGLTYTPGMYASDAELTELCRVVAAHGGYYCPHHRSYGSRRAGGLRGDDRGDPGGGLRPAPGARHDELRRERGPRPRAARAAGRGARRRGGHHPRHVSLPAGLHDARVDPAELGDRGRSGGDPRPAPGRRAGRAHPARDGGGGLGRLPRRARGVADAGGLRGARARPGGPCGGPTGGLRDGA